MLYCIHTTLYTYIFNFFFKANTFSLTSISHTLSLFLQKRFTLEKQSSSLGFQHWLKSNHFIKIRWYPWIKKRVNYLSCREGKFMTIAVFHNSTLQLIFYLMIILRFFFLKCTVHQCTVNLYRVCKNKFLIK